MSVKYGLLALLATEPMYGARLRAEFEARTGGTWPLNVGQVYTTLGRLERDGLVESVGEVRAGAAIVRDTINLSGDTVTAYTGTYAANESTGMPDEVQVTGERTLTLISAPADAHITGTLPFEYAAIVPSEVVAEEGWATTEEGGVKFLVSPAQGQDITAQEETLIGERLDQASFSVERGHNDETTLFFAILVGAISFILLVIILTSTALSMAEQRRDDSTLAAVGATRGTRRAMAAAQGFTAAAIGALLGLVVGIIPGIAFAYPLPRTSADGTTFINGAPVETSGPFIEIPYGFLAVLVIGVPVLAAVISALAVRRAPVVTRRAG